MLIIEYGMEYFFFQNLGNMWPIWPLQLIRASSCLCLEISARFGKYFRKQSQFTFKHVYAGLGRVTHGIHEHWWQELCEENSDLWAAEFVGQQLGKEVGCLLTCRCIARVTVQIQQVDQRTYKVTRLLCNTIFLCGFFGSRNLQKVEAFIKITRI